MAENEQPTVHLVTTGEYSDFRVEYAVTTVALAEVGAEILRREGELDVEIRSLPVLSEIPTKVTMWMWALMKNNDRRGEGFGTWHALVPIVDPEFWSYEVPEGGAPLVEVEESVIRVYHQDEDTGRGIVETILQHMNGHHDGRPE